MGGQPCPSPDGLASEASQCVWPGQEGTPVAELCQVPAEVCRETCLPPMALGLQMATPPLMDELHLPSLFLFEVAGLFHKEGLPFGPSSGRTGGTSTFTLHLGRGETAAQPKDQRRGSQGPCRVL